MSGTMLITKYARQNAHGACPHGTCRITVSTLKFKEKTKLWFNVILRKIYIRTF